jgi:hypothetical protein
MFTLYFEMFELVFYIKFPLQNLFICNSRFILHAFLFHTVSFSFFLPSLFPRLMLPSSLRTVVSFPDSTTATAAAHSPPLSVVKSCVPAPFSVFFRTLIVFFTIAATSPHEFLFLVTLTLHLGDLTNHHIAIPNFEHVPFPTRRINIILVLGITYAYSSLQSNITFSRVSPSDHFSYLFFLSISPATPRPTHTPPFPPLTPSPSPPSSPLLLSSLSFFAA